TAGPFQVFGVNTDVPTVLFYDERQPVANFLDSLGFWGKRYLETLRVKRFGYCNDNKIWLDPKKGELCEGPEGPHCEIPDEELELGSGGVPCSAELLQDDSCLRFLASCKSKDVDQWITGLIAGEFNAGESEVPEVHQPTNATIAVGGVFWEEGPGCVGEREAMGNGATRFTLGDKGDYFRVLSGWEERQVWMSQASCVFHQRGVSLDDDLSQYVLICPRLSLDGHLSTSETTCQRRCKKTIYLFVHPPTPSTPTKRCTTSSLHHWSFDSTGQHPLPPETCEDLGLPTELDFEVSLNIRYRWTNEACKWMHEYQLARGFDPKTPDFARHLGYSTYQVQSDSDRFEDVDGASNVLFHAYLVAQLFSCSHYGLPNTISCRFDVVRARRPLFSLPSTNHPLQHTLSTPFDNQNPYPGASATTPITSLYSCSSFTGHIYPNDYTSSGWNVNLSPLGLPHSRFLSLPPISSLGLPAAYPLPSLAHLNSSEELRRWSMTDTSSLKRRERDDLDLERIAGDSRKRARFAKTYESDTISRLWPAQEGSSERFERESDRVVGLRETQPYASSGGMGRPVTQMSSLEEEVRRLREENERLRGMVGAPSSGSVTAV
ncbi:hypothetical protein V5O48_015176, partial [Marasmius crinis-equi]